MNYQKLSKNISFALRHAPWEFELEIDENGWVQIENLLESLRCKKEWQKLSKQDLYAMIENSDKKRYEISENKIRAMYGHSITKKIIKEIKEPPEILYHGTSNRFISSIMEKGLLPKGRQYVHLSLDVETATQVGKRHDNKPIILKINSKHAWRKGINFYEGNALVWLADIVPSDFIEKL